MLEMVKALHPTPALGGLPQKMGLAIIRMKKKWIVVSTEHRLAGLT